MKKIQMADLQGQYNNIAPEIDAAMQNVCNEAAFINGPAVREFQQNLERYTGSKHVIPCGNGTDALQISLMALGLQPGDEVILPAFTYAATAEAAALLGLKPVFADVDPFTFNLSHEALENAITKHTKTIIPVHLFGQCTDMEPIAAIAAAQNLSVIEDNAQAIGAEYSFRSGEKAQAGTMGTVGTTSFFPSKNLGCFGDGGAILTNDEKLAERVRMIANHGQSRKYYHEIIGVNSRLDTLQAVILNIKLKHLTAYTSARQKAAAFYDQALAAVPEISIPACSPNSTHVYHQYTIKVENGQRDNLKRYLEAKGIPSMVYYPVPVHLQKAYQYLGYKKGDFPVSEELCEKVLSLPMHTELEPGQLGYIAENVISFFR